MQQPRKEPPALLTKAEACTVLGCSPRTLDNLIAGGKIAHTYAPGRTRTVVVFSPAEVERVRLEREERLHVGVVTEDGTGSQALARRESRNLAKHAEKVGPGLQHSAEFPALFLLLRHKLALSVKEAALLTGYSQAKIRAAIHAGKLKGALGRRRGYDIKRSDLELWVKKL